MRSSFRSEPGISDSPIAQNLPADLPSGMYLIAIELKDKKEVKKVYKK